jgi:hypothetical protein
MTNKISSSITSCLLFGKTSGTSWKLRARSTKLETVDPAGYRFLDGGEMKAQHLYGPSADQLHPYSG